MFLSHEVPTLKTKCNDIRDILIVRKYNEMNKQRDLKVTY
jgi:hypothetical protein